MVATTLSVIIFFLNMVVIVHKDIVYLLKLKLSRICIYIYQIMFLHSFNIFYNFPQIAFSDIFLI